MTYLTTRCLVKLSKFVSLILSIIFIILISEVQGQNLLINEICSLNSALTDEDSDTPDWFEILNTGTEPINLSGYCVSDDADDLFKWEFPQLEIEPNAYMLIFASGKDRKELPNVRNLINEGDTFLYSIGSVDIPENWKENNFNTDAWHKGCSGFGYGDNDDKTLIPEGTVSVFVRKTFTISNVDDVKKLLFHIDYDDGFVAYINGVEVARANLGEEGSLVPYNQVADVDIEPLMALGLAPELFEFDNVSGFINTGVNTLAIQIHNQSSASTDITLIPFLSVEYFSNPVGNFMPQILGVPNKNLHTNFKISSEGESLLLVNSDGNIIDKTDTVLLPPGVSYGRSQDYGEAWLYFDQPTPGSVNNTKGYSHLGNNLISFSPAGGKYSSSKVVRLSSNSNDTIYYTTDGSEPTAESAIYDSEFSVNRTTVIKARVYSRDILSLSSSVETYIIEDRTFQIPIVSLSTNPEYLFDYETGILADGPGWTKRDPHFGANFWNDWERSLYFEYFTRHGDKVFEAPAGTKVFGGWSRGLFDQKSLALFARKAYGTKSFDYKFFNSRNKESFKSLVFRNSGNDNELSYFRDAFMTGLVRNIDIDIQAYQPTAVFLNGEYWGMLNLREKVNEDYLERNYSGIDADKLDILEVNANVVEGSADHYINMINYIKANGLSEDEDYNYVATQMDVENFMEYEIAQIYYDNKDWPGNNIKYWRPQRDNGRWRWILYDTDFGFGLGGNYSDNTLYFALLPDGPGWPNPPWSTFLLRSFVENDQFVHDFANRFADRLNHEFREGNVHIFIDSLKNNIIDEVPYHRSRWNSLWDFDNQVNYFHEFANNRPQFMRQYLEYMFELGSVVDLTVDVNNSIHGKVQVNTLCLDTYPWNGKYFANNSVPVSAIPEPGYEFSHWEGSNSSSSFLNLNIPPEGIVLKAVFKLSDKEYNTVVINEIKYSAGETNNPGDWIELYNSTRVDFDITGWKLEDSNSEKAFVFPKGSIIPAKQYVVVCKDIDDFSQVNPDVVYTIGQFKFGLSATSDMIRLFNKEGVTVDSVLYNDESPWPLASDNQTISLYNPFTDNALGANWQTSVGEGTPGRANDFFVKIDEEKSVAPNKEFVSCYPNPVNLFTQIKWRSEYAQNTIVQLVDVSGQMVKVIFNGKCNAGINQANLNFNEKYANGLYFINFRFENGVNKTLKIIKM